MRSSMRSSMSLLKYQESTVGLKPDADGSNRQQDPPYDAHHGFQLLAAAGPVSQY